VLSQDTTGGTLFRSGLTCGNVFDL